jgi:endonuclease/exonuclease/phosphatase family metal-dependent hydrolase
MLTESLKFAAVVWCCAALPGMAQSLSRGIGDLRVMTYNINEGSDFIEVSQAQTASQFLLGVGQTITQVRATNPPQRMQAVAREIADAAPLLVSLQEVDQWYSGDFDPATGRCGSVALEFDMLQELLDSLASLGANYGVAARARQYAFPPTPGLIPPATFLCVQVFDDNVTLVRTDLAPSRFQWSNPQAGQFGNIVSLQTPIGTIPLPRSWTSLDAIFNGKPFRHINTHLESFNGAIRRLQAAELRAGPASTSLPVILGMDSNAQAFPLPADLTYTDFLAAGYRDVWSSLFPFAPGFTCCQAQLVNNPVSELSQRIDLILTLGDIEAQDAALFGARPTSMTAAGLWPSDHAAVAAQLVVHPSGN